MYRKILCNRVTRQLSRPDQTQWLAGIFPMNNTYAVGSIYIDQGYPINPCYRVLKMTANKLIGVEITCPTFQTEEIHLSSPHCPHALYLFHYVRFICFYLYSVIILSALYRTMPCSFATVMSPKYECFHISIRL